MEITGNTFIDWSLIIIAVVVTLTFIVMAFNSVKSTVDMLTRKKEPKLQNEILELLTKVGEVETSEVKHHEAIREVKRKQAKWLKEEIVESRLKKIEKLLNTQGESNDPTGKIYHLFQTGVINFNFDRIEDTIKELKEEQRIRAQEKAKIGA